MIKRIAKKNRYYLIQFELALMMNYLIQKLKSIEKCNQTIAYIFSTQKTLAREKINLKMKTARKII